MCLTGVNAQNSNLCVKGKTQGFNPNLKSTFHMLFMIKLVRLSMNVTKVKRKCPDKVLMKSMRQQTAYSNSFNTSLLKLLSSS